MRGFFCFLFCFLRYFLRYKFGWFILYVFVGVVGVNKVYLNVIKICRVKMGSFEFSWGYMNFLVINFFDIDYMKVIYILLNVVL